MKIPAILIISIFALAGWYIFFGAESYFSLWPSINTRYSKHYTEENFNKITIGMSEDDLIQLMGEPLKINRHYKINTVTYSYSSDAQLKIVNFNWLEMLVILKDGKVIKVHKLVNRSYSNPT